MYPKTSCIIFRREQQRDTCHYIQCIHTHARVNQPPPQISKGAPVQKPNQKSNAFAMPFVSVRAEGHLDRMLKSGRTGVMTGDSAESSEPLKSSASREIRSGRWSHQSNVSLAPCLTTEPNTPASTDPLNWLSAGPATKASWQQGYFGAEITAVWTQIEMAKAHAIALH